MKLLGLVRFKIHSSLQNRSLIIGLYLHTHIKLLEEDSRHHTGRSIAQQADEHMKNTHTKRQLLATHLLFIHLRIVNATHDTSNNNAH
jgi:hypothetical protein